MIYTSINMSLTCNRPSAQRHWNQFYRNQITYFFFQAHLPFHDRLSYLLKSMHCVPSYSNHELHLAIVIVSPKSLLLVFSTKVLYSKQSASCFIHTWLYIRGSEPFRTQLYSGKDHSGTTFKGRSWPWITSQDATNSDCTAIPKRCQDSETTERGLGSIARIKGW